MRRVVLIKFQLQRLGAFSEDSNTNISVGSSGPVEVTLAIEVKEEVKPIEKRKARISSETSAYPSVDEDKENCNKQERKDRKDGKKNEWDMFAEADNLEAYNVSMHS